MIEPKVEKNAAERMLIAAGWTIGKTGTTYWGFTKPDGTKLHGRQANLTTAFEIMVNES
jgi:hypothetical protein